MVNVPSVPEIITVNSEALQEQIRDLLPSQNGFGSELQASNVITPIIDLTSTAEGSGLPSYLQTAIAFGSQTAFDVTNTTTTLLSSPGFYRVFGVSSVQAGSGGTASNRFSLTDGLSTKIVWRHYVDVNASVQSATLEFDFVVFLAAGESLTCTSSSNETYAAGSTRQLATGDGTLVQPSGYPL